MSHHNNTTTSSSGGVVDKAREFLTGARKEDTTEVDRDVAPAVVQERVERLETVDQVEAIDRERHVDHYQNRVQPITDHVELPTQHQYNVAPTVVRESKHDIQPEQREQLEQQRSLYTDTKEVGEVQRVHQLNPAVAQEHVHHHVHETIQPVINRDTVEKTHVHTTIPIHEKIVDAPVVHESTVLPTVSLKDFESKTGGTTGHVSGNHEHAVYEGVPAVAGSHTAATGSSHTHGTGLTGSNHGTGLTGSSHGTGLTGSKHDGLTGSNHGTGLTGNHGTGDHTIRDNTDRNNNGIPDSQEHHKKGGLAGIIEKVTGK